MLWLEQRLRECGVRLPEHDDVRAGGVALALERERLQRRPDFDAAAPQDAEHRAERHRVLASGDDVGVGPVAPSADRMRLDV